MRKFTLVVAVLVAVSLLAACSGSYDWPKAQMQEDHDRDLVVESMVEAAAADGADLARDDAECVIDVLLRYVDLDVLVEDARTGSEEELPMSEEDGVEVAGLLFEECPGAIQAGLEASS